MARVLILPDIHCPYDDPHTINAVLQYASDCHWDECVQLGDFIDLDGLSSHNDGKPGLIEGVRIREDFAAANALLDRITAAVRKVNKKCSITMLAGNHEDRASRYCERFPVLDGLLDVPSLLRIQDRGVRWVSCYPDGEDYQIGHLRFTHGEFCNPFAAKKHVEVWGHSVVFGHTHRVGTHMLARRGYDLNVAGFNVGFLARYDLPYVKSKREIQGWQQAFAEAHFRSDGHFNLYTTCVFDHQFTAPNGKTYDGRAKPKGVQRVLRTRAIK